MPLVMTATQCAETSEEHPDDSNADHDFAQRMMPIVSHGKQQHRSTDDQRGIGDGAGKPFQFAPKSISHRLQSGEAPEIQSS